MMPHDQSKPRRERRVRCATCRGLYLKAELAQHQAECLPPLGPPGWYQAGGTLPPPKPDPQSVKDAAWIAHEDVAIIPTGTGNAYFLPAAEAQRNIPHVETPPDVELVRMPGMPERSVSGWPLLRGRVSATSLGTFLGCPEKFRRQYILGEYGPSSGALIAGSAAHHAVEVAMRYWIVEHEPLPERLARVAFDTKFVKECDRASQVEWGDEPETEWMERGRGAALSYLEHVGNHLQPLAAEELFAIDVPGVPVPLVGFIDVVTEDRNIDMKFGAKKQRTLQPGWRVQGHCYLLANDKEIHWHSVNWKGEYHTPSDSDKLRLPLSADNYTIATNLVRSTVEAILAYTDAFGTEDPWPGAISHPWQCTLCSFKEDGCAWWNPPLRGLL